ncbi:MAG: hypothetical protein H7328_09035 [Bdellovibrio sp.]|nr:hypothetical protein [Bdellovibrio sp.]
MKEIEQLIRPITTDIPIRYHHLNAGPDKPVLIFFHGYADSAQAFLRRAYPGLDSRYEILAINGLFPVPQKKDNVWKQAFAWYFADFSTNSVLIHPNISANAVVHLIENLGLTSRVKLLLAFSQGGFFLPHILPYLKNVKHMISIAAAYASPEYQTNLNVPLDAIHGTEDDIVTFESGKTSFESLKKHNPHGIFKSFEGLRHTMNDESRAWLKDRIDHILK